MENAFNMHKLLYVDSRVVATAMPVAFRRALKEEEEGFLECRKPEVSPCVIFLL